jgi:hypothetical protein
MVQGGVTSLDLVGTSLNWTSRVIQTHPIRPSGSQAILGFDGIKIYPISQTGITRNANSSVAIKKLCYKLSHRSLTTSYLITSIKHPSIN